MVRATSCQRKLVKPMNILNRFTYRLRATRLDLANEINCNETLISIFFNSINIEAVKRVLCRECDVTLSLSRLCTIK